MKNNLQISYGSYSSQGLKNINQDFCDIAFPNEPFLTTKGIALCMADGISSSDVSQEASQVCVQTFLEDYFIIEDIVYFSTYFFLTRVYNDTFNFDNIQQYDTNAKMIVDCGLELFNDKIIGPQFCMLLKKKIKIL